jgi:hypothetical protein
MCHQARDSRAAPASPFAHAPALRVVEQCIAHVDRLHDLRAFAFEEGKHAVVAVAFRRLCQNSPVILTIGLTRVRSMSMRSSRAPALPQETPGAAGRYR